MSKILTNVTHESICIIIQTYLNELIKNIACMQIFVENPRGIKTLSNNLKHFTGKQTKKLQKQIKS